MNAPIWVAWVVVAVLAALSIMWLLGKGSFLIAGFNTISKEKKQQYDKKRLCRVMGCGFSVLTIIMGISTYYEFELPVSIGWIIPWGFLSTIAVTVLLVNIVGRKRLDR